MCGYDSSRTSTLPNHYIPSLSLHYALPISGDLVRADRSEESLWLHGVVSPDRTQALFSLAAVGRSGESQHDRLRFPGLDPATRYRIRPLRIGAEPSGLDRQSTRLNSSHVAS